VVKHTIDKKKTSDWVGNFKPFDVPPKGNVVNVDHLFTHRYNLPFAQHVNVGRFSVFRNQINAAFIAWRTFRRRPHRIKRLAGWAVLRVRA